MFTAAAIVAVLCWRQVGTSSGSAGMGEGARALVSSSYPARIQKLLVQPYQAVQAGDPVAIIVPNDPRLQFDLLQSELNLARMQLQPTIAEENAMNFEQIRIDLLRTKSELAMARVNHQMAENQARRNEPLFREKLVSEDVYDVSVKTRDMYAAEVFEKSNAVAQIEQRIGALEALGIPQSGPHTAFAASLERLKGLQGAASSNAAPITLTAPIDGLVSAVWKRGGEQLVDGEPIVTISSTRSERVVGYLRQPYPMQPEVGQPVAMFTRERRPRKFAGVITQIGAQVEPITNALAFVRPGTLVDSGLPIIISLPPGAPLRPGEIVDLHFRNNPLTATREGAPQHASVQ